MLFLVITVFFEDIYVLYCRDLLILPCLDSLIHKSKCHLISLLLRLHGFILLSMFNICWSNVNSMFNYEDTSILVLTYIRASTSRNLWTFCYFSFLYSIVWLYFALAFELNLPSTSRLFALTFLFVAGQHQLCSFLVGWVQKRLLISVLVFSTFKYVWVLYLVSLIFCRRKTLDPA